VNGQEKSFKLNYLQQSYKKNQVY